MPSFGQSTPIAFGSADCYDILISIMLMLDRSKRRFLSGRVLTGVGVLLLGSGLYMLSLVGAPVLMPIISMQPITPEALASPSETGNRIVIPKIGVDIEYGKGEVALDNGAQWRWPERGNPEDGGNFVIAAHRFTLAATPQQTVRLSPFYHIDKLEAGDQLIVDYEGRRYGYEVAEMFDVNPDRVEIEAPTDDHRLTLYSCGLGGADDVRLVIFAKPLGEVSVKPSSTSL